MIRVALDAMGSDDGPEGAVEAAAMLSLEEQPIQVVLVGDAAELSPILDEQRYDPSRLSIVHAAETIHQEDTPREAVDSRPEASVLVAAELVQRGEADALVSAGNTGALILSASRTFERLPGIRRAALASVYPTEQRHGPHADPFALMLDVGATVGATAEDLVGFAVMGAAYSRVISETENPRVALLSNGTESHKGTAAIVEAHRQLRTLESVDFVGNVEGLDIPKGTVDVVVCDGFLGNVVLKMLEGVSEVVVDMAKDASARRILFRLGLTMLSQGLREIRTMTDWRQYGGAPILGFEHVVIKSHGRSSTRALRNAVRVAAKAVERDLCGRIEAGLDKEPLPGGSR